MHSPKKHPLEIFRESGGHGPLVPHSSGAPAPEPHEPVVSTHEARDRSRATAIELRDAAQEAASAEGESPAKRRPHPRWAPQEFELRLSAYGAFVLALTWIVLLAAAFYFGQRTERQRASAEQRREAVARGQSIEEAATAAAAVPPSDVAPAASRTPFGVRIVSYDGKDLERNRQLYGELVATLEQRYGIPQSTVHGFDVGGGALLVYVGAFASKDDPELKALEVKLRSIADWPRSQKKNPFETALVASHPEIAPPRGGAP
jgi:hypothetical protein